MPAPGTTPISSKEDEWPQKNFHPELASYTAALATEQTCLSPQLLPRPSSDCGHQVSWSSHASLPHRSLRDPLGPCRPTSSSWKTDVGLRPWGVSLGSQLSTSLSFLIINSGEMYSSQESDAVWWLVSSFASLQHKPRPSCFLSSL